MNIYYYLYKNNTGKQKEKAGHQAAYVLLSYILEKEYGIFKFPKIEKSPYGKPYFPDYPQIHFNISHCDNMAVCVTAGYEVGIDIERKRQVKQILVKKVLTQKEQIDLQKRKEEEFEMAFLQYWTLKESFIKAIGRGLSFPLCDIEFYFDPDQIFWNLYPKSDFQPILEKQSPFALNLYSVIFTEEYPSEIEKPDPICLKIGSFTIQNQILSNQEDWCFFQVFLEEEYLLSLCIPHF